MKFLTALLFFVTAFAWACNKDGFTTSPNAALQFNADTVRFDTVFTSIGSVTKSFTILNNNNRKLRIQSVRLAGGNSSPFTINVNGIAGTDLHDVDIDANDSAYVFVKVTVDPAAATNPFLLLDSLIFDYNGNTSKVYLQAYGQDAIFIKGGVLSANANWHNGLPYVIENSLLIAPGTTLTIDKGTRVYVNAKAAFIVAGTLKVNGESGENDNVIFKSDRLDEPYGSLPAGWPGIVFTESSSNNELNGARILNAYQAIVSEGGANNAQPKLTLNQCIIHNAYDIGIYAVNSSVTAVNCLISQCGNDAQTGIGGSNILIAGGGTYHFTHCTVATYASYYQLHKQPACFISNKDGASTGLLKTNFTNCIIYGEGGMAKDELLVEKSAPDEVVFTNCLYKVKDADPAGVVFNNCIRNNDPLFDSINTSRQQYNFRLKDISPAIDAAIPTSILSDLDGNPRPVGTRPDMGCYEKQ